MAEPNIGRSVHYTSFGTPGGEYESECRAAIVTEVDEPGTTNGAVGLAVLNPTGLFFNRHVPYAGNGQRRRGGTWHWPEPAGSNPYGAAIDRLTADGPTGP
jgi:hypothetical protein